MKHVAMFNTTNNKIMNRKVLLTMAVGACLSLTSPAQFVLSGAYTLSIDVSSLQEKPGKLYFYYYNNWIREAVSDSADITANSKTIIMKGKIDEPVLASLRFLPKQPDGKSDVQRPGYSLNFYLDPGAVKVVVHDSLSASTITGSKSQDLFAVLNKGRTSYNEQLKPMYEAYSANAKAKDTPAMEATMKKIDAVRAGMREQLYKTFVLEHADNSPVVLSAISSYAGFDIKYDEVKPLFDKISPVYRNLPAGKAFLEKLETARKTGIGAMAMDFTQNDTLGNPVSLSSFRGKYVLIDFWASWCGPCRAENPNLVKAFHRYKDKGFTILGVSLDQQGQKDKWLKAIHDDQLTWTHVSDLKYWNNAVARQYAINAVPQSFLIGPDGKIIARNLRGEALNKKLEELLGSVN
jgi:peroxiredoxin